MEQELGNDVTETKRMGKDQDTKTPSEKATIYYADLLSDQCTKTLDLIQDNINFEQGYEVRNQKLLDYFYTDFTQNTNFYIEFLKASPDKKRLYLKPAFWVYYQFGVAYTWTNTTPAHVIFLLEEALKYNDDGDVNSADSLEVKEFIAQLKNPNFKNLERAPRYKVWLSRVVAFAVICLIIASCASR